MEQSNKTLTILIGCLVDNNDIQKLVSQYFKKFVSVSNLAYEKKLFDGFNNACIGDVVFLSAPIVGNYPTTSKKMSVCGFKNSNSLHVIKYSCLIGYRNISKSKALKKELQKILHNSEEKYEKIHVIACEYHKPYLDCLRFAKKAFNTKTTLIIPDLPRHVGNHGRFYSFLKKKEEKKAESLIEKYVDSFVCFTNDINNEININSKPYIISEGIISEIKNTEAKNDSNCIVCTYIGKLDKTNGVELLLKAANILPANYSIHIYGSGEMGNMLSNLRSKKLFYHGFINPDEVAVILEKSDVLLSPRFPDFEYVRYSFPSKIFDYLSSAKPIVTFKLPCYFKELDEVLVYLNNNSPEELTKRIIEASNSAQTRINSLKKLFDKYNALNTAKRIHDLLEM